MLSSAGFLSRNYFERRFFEPTGTKLEQGLKSDPSQPPQTVAQNLTVPWEIAFLPGGDKLVTERSGTLKRIGGSNQVYNVSGVEHVGEGGLLGLAIHPEFAQNRYIYIYQTTKAGGGLVNRVDRYRYSESGLSEKFTIIDNITGAPNHDGGRLAFGPDKLLYITTGDAGQEDAAQDTNSLAGKILRLKGDGNLPADNPFGNAVYSYGHRNPQGIAWDDKGRLWATEHGRSGLESGFDELNLIKKGSNYGWPLIEGDQKGTGMESPVAQSGANETWAPAGLAYLDGSLFFGGLRGESLYEATISGDNVSLKNHYRGEFGRLRAVASDSGRFLYISTSNTDGRGKPSPDDDRIIRFNPILFRN